MSSIQSIEIDGELVGILSQDASSRSFQFHSGVAPYDLLDGSRFSRPTEAYRAVRRIHSAGRSLRRQAERALDKTLDPVS